MSANAVMPAFNKEEISRWSFEKCCKKIFLRNEQDFANNIPEEKKTNKTTYNDVLSKRESLKKDQLL